MNKNLLMFFFCLIFFSCEKKQENTTFKYDIIDKDKIVNVLVDCYLVEGALISNQQDGTYAKEYSIYYYNYVFKKHHITRDQLFESMKYYSYRIKELSKIYIDVQNKLASLQATPPSKKK